MFYVDFFLQNCFNKIIRESNTYTDDFSSNLTFGNGYFELGCLLHVWF